MATLNAFGFATRKQRYHNVPAKVMMNVNPSVAFIQPIDNNSFQLSEFIKKPIMNIPQQSTSITTRKNNTIKKTNNKKKAPTNKNTITNYFTQQTNMDVEMEEPTANAEAEEENVVCVIRKKLPMMDMWNLLQDEYAQDPLFDDDDDDDDYEEEPQQSKEIYNNNNNRGRCRRYSEVEQDTMPSLLKRQKTVDSDLSDVMSRFLNLHSRIKPPPLQQASCIQVVNDFAAEQVKEEEEEENLTRVLRYKMTIEESHLFVLKITHEFLC